MVQFSRTQNWRKSYFIGGAAQGAASGNVLIDTLNAIPSLMKTLNAENNALNGQSINEEVEGLVKSIAGPAKGLLVSSSEND